MGRYLMTVITFPLLILLSKAQSELGIIGADNILQSDFYNPANFHQDGWHLALPSVLYNFYHTGPGFKDLFESRNGSILKVSALKDGLQKENFLNTDIRFQTFKLKYGKEAWSFGFDHEIILRSSIKYPGNLVNLYVDGNQQFVGQTIDIGPEGQIYSLNSYGFLVSYRRPTFTIGVKPRLLFGQHFGNTVRSSAALTTSEDVYQVSLQTDFQFDNSGLLFFEESNFFNYQVQAFDRWKLFTSNPGVALDLGTNLRFSERFQFSFSLIDWGSISWRNEVKTYRSNQTKSYTGLEVVNLFDKEEISIDGALDSLEAIFDLQESNNPINFKLPAKWIAVANYDFTSDLSACLISYYQNQSSNPLVVGLQMSAQFWPTWKITTTVSNRYNQFNLGLMGTWIRTRWIGYIATDQVLTKLNPFYSSHFNLRMGINIHFKGTDFQ